MLYKNYRQVDVSNGKLLIKTLEDYQEKKVKEGTRWIKGNKQVPKEMTVKSSSARIVVLLVRNKVWIQNLSHR